LEVLPICIGKTFGGRKSDKKNVGTLGPKCGDLGGFSTDMKCGDFKDSKSNPKCGDLGG
jgi:hypothetical protein